MEAIAHSPEFAKKAGVSQSVGKDFAAADKGRSFEGGGAVKGYMGRETKFAEGGPVTARSGDWKKTVPNRGFLDTRDDFRGESHANTVADRGPANDESWGKGSSKSNPAQGDKSEKPIKPRG